jgi:hypothetical protein
VPPPVPPDPHAVCSLLHSRRYTRCTACLWLAGLWPALCGPHALSPRHEAVSAEQPEGAFSAGGTDPAPTTRPYYVLRTYAGLPPCPRASRMRLRAPCPCPRPCRTLPPASLCAWWCPAPLVTNDVSFQPGFTAFLTAGCPVRLLCFRHEPGDQISLLQLMLDCSYIARSTLHSSPGPCTARKIADLGIRWPSCAPLPLPHGAMPRHAHHLIGISPRDIT